MSLFSSNAFVWKCRAAKVEVVVEVEETEEVETGVAEGIDIEEGGKF